MKKFKNILFLLFLGILTLLLSISLLLPDRFYEQLFTTSKSTEVSSSPIKAANEPLINTPKNNIEVITGMDWRLPRYAKRSNFGGLIDETGASGINDYIRGDFYKVRWDKTNPAPGKYNFTELQHLLDNNPEQQALLRPEVQSRCEAPDWALKQLRYSRGGSLIFWDEQYLDILKPYIHELAKFVDKNPQIIGVQLGIGDGEYLGDCKRFDFKNGWGEFNMNPKELLEAETDFGFTPDLLESTTKKIVTAYAEAFGNNRHKLAFNNIEQFSWTSIAKPYNKRMPAIAKHVLGNGLGGRDGQVEHWMRYIKTVYGMKLSAANNNTCSLDMDETIADKVEDRYWGTENEIYGDMSYVLEDHGSYENQPYRFLISSLRSLQMRRNYSLIYGSSMKKIAHPVYKTQDFLRYLDKTMGKLRNDTPDLFILLGERYVADYRVEEYPERKSCQTGNSTAIRSFGRWITEKSNSQPTMKISMPESDKRWGQGYYLPRGTDFEYAARSSNEFAFNINEKLGQLRCPKNCTVEIKLTYLDSKKSVVWIKTSNGQSSKLQTIGDGKLKTASFNIDLPLNNASNQDDFWVKSEKNPLSLMLLRINLPNP